MTSTSDIDVAVREVGLRDGLQMHQAPSCRPTRSSPGSTPRRAAGVREIEVSSFVPPKLLPQFADAEEVIARRAGDSRPDGRGADAEPEGRRARRRARRAQAQLRHVGEREPQHEAMCAATARSRSRISGASPTCCAAAPGPAARICSAGLPPRSAAPSRATSPTIDVRALRRQRWPEAGADEIAVADTVGFANPAAIARRCSRAVHGRGRADAGGWRISTTRAGSAWPMWRPRSSAGVRALRCLAGRARRLPLCARRDRQHRHGGRCASCSSALGFDTGIDLEKLVEVREIVRAALPGDALYGRSPRPACRSGFQPAATRERATA